MIRMVVLYENQVTHASDSLDIGSAQYHVENIYLAHRDAEQVFDRIRHHLEAGTFTIEDRFDLAFALHMRRSRSLEDMVRQSMELIQQIPDHQERSYVAAIFVELGIRWLDDASKQQIRKWVERVDLVKEIVDDAVEKAVEKAIVAGRNEGEHQKAIQVAEKMFRKGYSVSDVVEITGLSEQDAEEIRRNL